jgi:hypothetical protein|uniref:Uncharacterized protein n=1 Tax=viral metagenome TaxID=1070528 RepID=A0A6C0LW16_9ZZZZ
MFLYLPWKFQNSRVLNCKLNNDIYLLNLIRVWVIKQDPSINTPTHWWCKDLPSNINELFCDISKNNKIIEMFKTSFGNDCIVDILDDMNEIYVSPPLNNNKNFKKNAPDNIFYTRHIDGPFFYIPFASCYRVIVGLDDNRDTMTVFNIIPETYIIKTGDVVGFDFNRECHYVTPIIRYNDINNDTIYNKKYRVILKIHYCVYPKWAFVFGFILSKLSIMYNKLFRALLLFTLKSQNKYIKCLAKSMTITTKVYHDIEYYIGNNNIQYILLLYFISTKTNYYVLLLSSSFIHYLRWIDTSVNNIDINNIFRRDYYFYKFIYMLQFIHMYLSYKIENPILYTSIIVPTIFTTYVSKYTIIIPKLIEIYLTYDMLNNYNNLKYVEYIYIYVNILFNYIQLYKPIDM